MELREAFESTPDLMIVWVMSEAQVNERGADALPELEAFVEWLEAKRTAKSSRAVGD